MSTIPKLSTRQLGKNGPQVLRVGLGLVDATGAYGAVRPEAERLAFLDDAYKRGETFWDTGTSFKRYSLQDDSILQSS